MAAREGVALHVAGLRASREERLGVNTCIPSVPCAKRMARK